MSPASAPRVLSIAGTDPTGGAGIQADLKSIAATGGYGMAVVTALVAQNTRGVRSVHVPPVAFLGEQLDAVSDDVQVDAVKIGMLGGVDVIGAVASWLDRVRPPVVVLDPVMVATSGDRLLDDDAEDALRTLLSRADLVTPNVPELAILAGEPPATDVEAAVAQALRVSSAHQVRVLAKGGHLEGTTLVDVLVDAGGRLADGQHRIDFSGPRIDTTCTHGTGCSLSAALATTYARLGSWEESVGASRSWLAESIRHGADLHVGEGHGPVHHFAGLWARGGLTTREDAHALRRRWWEGIEDISTAIDDLPFITRLRDGTLDRDDFTWYLAQDALYLRDYSRRLADASALAPSVDEQEFWAQSAYGAIATEMELHASWVETEAAVRPSATTTAYLNHLAAAARRGYAVLAAALLPCFWIYQDVGSRLHPSSSPGHPYRSWLDTYADEAFEKATRRAIDIVSSAASGADDDTRQQMWVAFRESALHERAFFEAPLRRS